MKKHMLDIKINDIEQLVQIFLPGFIFLAIYKYFTERKFDSSDITIIGSVSLSYVFGIISQHLCAYLQINEKNEMIVSIVLSVILAFISVRIKQSEICKNFFVKYGKITGRDDIWHDVFNLNRGTHVRFFANYNYEEVMIEGNIKYFSSLEDGSCNIALSKYKIIYLQRTEEYEVGDRKTETLFFINTKNIHGLETTTGCKQDSSFTKFRFKCKEKIRMLVRRVKLK